MKTLSCRERLRYWAGIEGGREGVGVRKQQLMTPEERNAGKGRSREEHQGRVGLKGETAKMEDH